MTAPDYPRRTAFKLIGELREILAQQVNDEALAAAKRKDEYRGSCGPYLKVRSLRGGGNATLHFYPCVATEECRARPHPPFQEMCQKYEDLANVDKLTAVNAQVDEVKAVMEANINKVLENTENLENLQAKRRPPPSPLAPSSSAYPRALASPMPHQFCLSPQIAFYGFRASRRT